MSDDAFRPSLSVSAHAALQLEREVEAARDELIQAASRFGLISQKYVILTEALKLTITDMNGGTYPAPLNQRHFPELNSHG